MARLRDYSWWPNAWANNGGRALTSSEIRQDAVLKNVRRAGKVLTLMVEHNGVICTAQIGSPLSEDFLILLRHILLQHWGEPIADVETVEINFSGLGLQ